MTGPIQPAWVYSILGVILINGCLMPKLTELPSNLDEFLKFIRPSVSLPLSREEGETLNHLYIKIKELERNHRRFMPDISKLMSAVGCIEQALVRRNDPPLRCHQDYDALFHGDLPDTFKKFLRLIWFRDYLLKNEHTATQIIRDLYVRIKLSSRYGNGTEKSQKSLIGILEPIEKSHVSTILNSRNSRDRLKFESDFSARLSMIKDALPEIDLGKDLKRSKPTASEKLNELKNTPTIGLGLMSSFVPKKIRRDEVLIDSKTKRKALSENHALYIPGWTVTGAFADDEVPK